jgi:hypothetical protein
VRFPEQARAVFSSNPYASLSIGDDSDDSTVVSDGRHSRVLKSILKKSASSVPTASAVVGKVAKSSNWGVDSMASLHISGNKSLFTGGLTRCEPVKVQVANSEFVTATYRGTVYVRVKTEGGQSLRIPFDKVYFNERFSSNLLSSQVLVRQKWGFHCTSTKSWMETPGGNRIALDTRGCVSMMNCSSTSPPAPGEQAFGIVSQVAGTKVNELVRLHHRLGHVSFYRMTAIMKDGTTLDVDKLNVTQQEFEHARDRITQCSVCIQGKGRRSDFGHRGVDRGCKPGEVLHMDTFC